MGLFITTLFENPFMYFAWVGMVAFSICFHEYAHAQMLYRLGDDTAAREGHLSLNPMVQMGPVSLVLLLLIGIAWGAVPVNTRHLRTRGAVAMGSFAGPAANLLLCLIFGAITTALMRWGGESPAAMLAGRLFGVGTAANGVLFVFNMLPVPMLDGWSVFTLFFPSWGNLSPQQVQNYSLIFMAANFLTPVGSWIWMLGSLLAQLVMRGWGQLFSLVF